MIDGQDVIDVSVVIPSYNRGATVRENFARWLLMRPQPKEFILVDDHSDAASEAVLRRLSAEIPRVRYLRLEENGGQAVSRSAGFAAATGKYMVSLDDDSWLLERDGLRRVWDRMEAMPTCGILGFNLSSPGVKGRPIEDKLMVVADHLTCGAAYRTELLRRTGYHLACLRYMGEEADLSLKVLDAGYSVLHDFNVRGFHDYDASRRPREAVVRVQVYQVRNDLARTLVYFPLAMVPLLLLWKFLSHMRHGLVTGMTRPAIQGIVGFIRLMPMLFSQRSPVSVKTAIRYLKLRRWPEVVRG